LKRNFEVGGGRISFLEERRNKSISQRIKNRLTGIIVWDKGIDE
jgi:hypothetical protein